MHPDMLIPLLVMAMAFKVFYAIALLMRCRNEVLQREQNNRWVDEILEKL
jgi:heme exporter protein C